LDLFHYYNVPAIGNKKKGTRLGIPSEDELLASCWGYLDPWGKSVIVFGRILGRDCVCFDRGGERHCCPRPVWTLGKQ